MKNTLRVIVEWEAGKTPSVNASIFLNDKALAELSGTSALQLIHSDSFWDIAKDNLPESIPFYTPKHEGEKE